MLFVSHMTYIPIVKFPSFIDWALWAKKKKKNNFEPKDNVNKESLGVVLLITKKNVLPLMHSFGARIHEP